MQQIETESRPSRAGPSEESKTQSLIEHVSDLAGKSIFLEISLRLNILPALLSQTGASLEELSYSTGLPEQKLMSFLTALASTGLVEPVEEKLSAERTRYKFTDEFSQLRTMAGYLAWTHGACRPFVDHAEQFFREPSTAAEKYVRDGRLVAVSSEWMGETGFYFPVLEIIEKLKPQKIVDLGCGSGRLLRETLERFPTAIGIGIDMSLEACMEAKRNTPPNMQERIKFLHQRIEDLCDDDSCLEGADVISAAFVLHDLMPDKEGILDHILALCSKSLAGGTLAITEISPYEHDPSRRTFSTAVTVIHELFMFRKIMNKNEWEKKLLRSGFRSVEFLRVPFPAGMVILAS